MPGQQSDYDRSSGCDGQTRSYSDAAAPSPPACFGNP
jgi:hypothetical protein